MKLKRLILTTLIIISMSGIAKAQYYQIANQLTDLLSPALSGSFKYKGYVETTGLAGFGDSRANFYGVSTSQGFQYSSWFFMGAGIGIDVATGRQIPMPENTYFRTATTKAMIPVFSDFRFNVAATKEFSLMLDLKLGAAWLLGSRYFPVKDGLIDNSARFLLQPTIGLRIPLDEKSRNAVCVGITYRLLTANSSYYGYDSPTLNSLGLTIGYEW